MPPGGAKPPTQKNWIIGILASTGIVANGMQRDSSNSDEQILGWGKTAK